MTDVPPDVGAALHLYATRLGLFGRGITWYSEIGSTNDVALAMAEQGSPEGVVIGADLQTAGRGRQGRSWSSPPGSGLYVSTVLRPVAHAVPLVTIAAGVAIADGIREASGLTTTLKWPNDVYLNGRKVAGVLAEAGGAGSAVHHVVLGFGINVSQASHPHDVAARATSLEGESGRLVDRGLVLACCLSALSVRYDEAAVNPGRVLATWRSYAAPMLRRRVRCTVGSRTVAGIAEDIDERGALIVRTGGETVRVVSGEVVWS